MPLESLQWEHSAHQKLNWPTKALWHYNFLSHFFEPILAWAVMWTLNIFTLIRFKRKFTLYITKLLYFEYCWYLVFRREWQWLWGQRTYEKCASQREGHMLLTSAFIIIFWSLYPWFCLVFALYWKLSPSKLLSRYLLYPWRMFLALKI